MRNLAKAADLALQEPTARRPGLELVDALWPVIEWGGHWLEWQGDDETWTRGKLSWRSEVTNNCIFVNRRGMKLAEISVHEIAALFRAERRIRDRRRRLAIQKRVMAIDWSWTEPARDYLALYRELQVSRG